MVGGKSAKRRYLSHGSLLAVAGQALLGHGAGEQVGVDSLGDAGAVARVRIGGMAVALPREELGGIELARQGLGPLVGGGWVAGGPDDEDGCGTLGVERFRGLGAGVSPGLTDEVTGFKRGPEARRSLLQLLALLRPGGHVALDPVVQAVNGMMGAHVDQGAGGDLIQHRSEDGGVVLVDDLTQCLVDAAPCSLRGVEEQEDHLLHLLARHRAVRVAGGHGRLVGRVEEVSDLLHPGVGTVGERTALSRLAPVDIGPQRALEAHGLPLAALVVGQAGIDSSVEDHAAGVGREELGVVGPQVSILREISRH